MRFAACPCSFGETLTFDSLIDAIMLDSSARLTGLLCGTQPMNDIWSPRATLQRMLDVEAALDSGKPLVLDAAAIAAAVSAWAQEHGRDVAVIAVELDDEAMEAYLGGDEPSEEVVLLSRSVMLEPPNDDSPTSGPNDDRPEDPSEEPDEPEES